MTTDCEFHSAQIMPEYGFSLTCILAYFMAVSWSGSEVKLQMKSGVITDEM